MSDTLISVNILTAWWCLIRSVVSVEDKMVVPSVVMVLAMVTVDMEAVVIFPI